MIRSTRVGSRNHILKIASAHPGSATNRTGPNRTSTSQIGLELKFGSAFLFQDNSGVRTSRFVVSTAAARVPSISSIRRRHHHAGMTIRLHSLWPRPMDEMALIVAIWLARELHRGSFSPPVIRKVHRGEKTRHEAIPEALRCFVTGRGS